MRYLLDTCIVSETNKRLPNANLMQYLAGVATSDLFISVVTIGELRSGARSVKDAALRRKLSAWIDEVVVPRFQDRILDIDIDIADHWGCLMGDGAAKGCTPSATDSMIAATAWTPTHGVPEPSSGLLLALGGALLGLKRKNRLHSTAIDGSRSTALDGNRQQSIDGIRRQSTAIDSLTPTRKEQ